MTVRLCLCVFILLLALPVQGGAVQGANAEAAEGAAALHFESVFDDYRPYEPQPVAPWRKSNDRVGEIGGWRTYAQEGVPPMRTDNERTAEPHSEHGQGEER